MSSGAASPAPPLPPQPHGKAPMVKRESCQSLNMAEIAEGTAQAAKAAAAKKKKDGGTKGCVRMCVLNI